jgi:hypothetical protein
MLDEKQEIQVKDSISGKLVDRTCYWIFYNEENVKVRAVQIGTFKKNYVRARHSEYTIRHDVITLYSTLGCKLTCTKDEEILTTKGYIKAGEFIRRRYKNIPLIAVKNNEIFYPLIYSIRRVSYAKCIDFKLKNSNNVLVNSFLVRR